VIETGFVQSRNASTVIPGHGPVTTKAGLLAYRNNNVERLRIRATELIREGRSQDDVGKVMIAEFGWAPDSLLAVEPPRYDEGTQSGSLAISTQREVLMLRNANPRFHIIGMLTSESIDSMPHTSDHCSTRRTFHRERMEAVSAVYSGLLVYFGQPSALT
jgi:hypothetical protein